MSLKSVLALGFVLVAATPGLAWAQTVYNDGLDHSVTGPNGPIVVRNDGTALTVDSPASITGSAGILGGAGIAGGAGTAINLQGGQVNGVGASGISTDGSFTGSGGLVVGGNNTLNLQYLSVSGVSVLTGGTADILGGTYVGGNQYGSLTHSAGGAGLCSDGVSSCSGLPATVTILGGTFVGGNATGTLGGYGGQGVNIASNFSISGGTFLGGLGNTAAYTGLSAQFSIGDQGVHETGTISGGTFGNGAGFLVWGNSLVNISGGSFADGLGLNLNGSSSLNFFGSDLSWTEINPKLGELTGTLADGTAINTSVSVAGDYSVLLTGSPGSEELSFRATSATPEPASFVMLGVGIAGVAIACKCKRVRRRLPGDSQGSGD